MFIFSDGNIVHSKEYLQPNETAFIEVADLLIIPERKGMTGYYYADLETNEIKIGYFDTPEPLEELIPEPENASTPAPVTNEELKRLLILNADMTNDLIDLILESEV